MSINEKKLFQLLMKLKKVELIDYLKISFSEMNDKQKRHVFRDFYDETTNSDRTPQKLYSDIKSFYKRSNDGAYYVPFNINSQNYMYVPNETDEWFSELSKYLDESSKLVKVNMFDLANRCFEKLYDLIEKMGNGDEIIFAHEYGTWMITAKLDYDESYIKSIAKTSNEVEFTKKLIPILIRDSYESLSGKIYDKVKKYSNAKQFEEIRKAIKSRNIKVS